VYNIEEPTELIPGKVNEMMDSCEPMGNDIAGTFYIFTCPFSFAQSLYENEVEFLFWKL
jgi:hypothetical protein